MPKLAVDGQDFVVLRVSGRIHGEKRGHSSRSDRTGEGPTGARSHGDHFRGSRSGNAACGQRGKMESNSEIVQIISASG
jgi:hypothetical protein